MHPLLSFWNEKGHDAIPPYRNDIVLKTVEDVLIVNLDAIYERTYGYRAIDQLVYLMCKQEHNKKLIFLSRDGANLSLTGITKFIEHILNFLNLNQDSCIIICREPISITGVTTFVFEAIPMWCAALVEHFQEIKITNEPLEKKFAAWYNRGTFFRLIIVKHLFDNYLEDSFISYQEKKIGMIYDHKLKDFFADEISWAQKNTPINYDQPFPTNGYPSLDYFCSSNRKPYGKYFVDIVAETDILSTSWLTEKTVRNLFAGVPFISMGGHAVLEKIRSFGFKTFSPYIDESYDNVKNPYQRLENIKKEIDRIANMSYNQLNEIRQALIPILHHNREICFSFKDYNEYTVING
jgi:hypothetical protein